MISIRTAAARQVTAMIAAVLVGGSLFACSGGDSGGDPAAGSGSGSAAELDAALQQGGSLTYWTWTPSAQAQVAAFEKAYPKVDVKLVNAGTNTDEYTKLQNVVDAGSGAPDVAQIEYYALPQFALSNALLDLRQYGLADLKTKYTASTWNSVDIGGKLYGLPQDSGPMAMFYNATVFTKYGIQVPTTWDDYIAAARKLHAADPKKYIASDTGDAGFTTSMIWQAGGHPMTVDGTKVKIDFADAGSRKWATAWSQLLTGGLLAPIPGWNDEWYKALGDGTIATLVTGAWMPGVLQSSVAKAAGDWRVAPIPTYDGTPVTAENGGGGQSVLRQSKSPALAAAFVRWLNSDPASLKIFTDSGGFPSTVAELQAPAFLDHESKYFGGQKINQVLTAAAGKVAPGWSYLPFEVYANSIFGDTVGQSYVRKSDLSAGLASWQQRLVSYGKQQGFDVEG
jgi:multiple sugar transport system substrate-binding protein